MYYELYIDVVFLENLLLDFLLLSLLKRILKCSAGRLRRLLAAVLGSTGICLMYVFSVEQGFFRFLFIYVLLGTVMVKIGLHIKDRRTLGKAVILLYLCSMLLGGIFQWVQERVSLPVYPFLGISLISFCLLEAGMHWLMRFRSGKQNLYQGTVRFHGRTVPVKILRDTGNYLRDPVFGKPVSIITEELQKELCQEEEILFYAVPFHSIGRENGIMQAFFADCLCIQTPEGEAKVIARPLLGVTKEPLSSKDEYDMILHPELLE